MNLLDIAIDIFPILSFVQDFFSGPCAHFGIPSDTPYYRGDIKRMLQNNGVEVWALLYNLSGDMLTFSVAAYQIELTYVILDDAGIPVLYGPERQVIYD